MRESDHTIWSRMNQGRFAVISILAPALAFFLIMFLATRGDSDLPPYDPPTVAERVCRIVGAALVLPAYVVGSLFGAGILFGLSFVLSGMFWALLLEIVVIAKNGRRA